MKKIQISIVFVALIIFCNESINAQAFIDLETGIVGTGYNNVRIPGNGGTLFSLRDDLNPKSQIFIRLRAGYTINSRHTVSLLYAPLETRSDGSVAEDITFEGAVFPANTDITGTYKFNSYRLTYRYEIVQKPKLEFGMGFTAKIRDAKISLESDGLFSEKTNTGFVPIINFRLHWKLNEKFGLLLDGDALAAKQGRAEDILVAAMYRPSDRIGFKVGYRILEGGADNEEVYNFALFNYAVGGLILYL